MTELRVTPIDNKARGSHGERKRVMRALARYSEMQESKDIRLILKAWDELEDILPKYLSTDDGSDPMIAFDDISSDQFDTLSLGLLGGVAVPEAKSVS